MTTTNERTIRCHCGKPMSEDSTFFQNVGECEMCHFLGDEYSYEPTNDMPKTNCAHVDDVDVPEMDPTCRDCYYHELSVDDGCYVCGYSSYQERLAHSEPTDEYHLVPHHIAPNVYDEYDDGIPF